MPTLKTATDHVFNALSRLLARQPAWNRCDACGQLAQVIYLLPSPFELSRRCDHCRDTWHHAVRMYHATRTATVATAQPDPLKTAAR